MCHPRQWRRGVNGGYCHVTTNPTIVRFGDNNKVEESPVPAARLWYLAPCEVVTASVLSSEYADWFGSLKQRGRLISRCGRSLMLCRVTKSRSRMRPREYGAQVRGTSRYFVPMDARGLPYDPEVHLLASDCPKKGQCRIGNGPLSRPTDAAAANWSPLFRRVPLLYL